MSTDVLQELKNKLFDFKNIHVAGISSFFIQEWYETFVVWSIKQVEEKLTKLSKDEQKTSLLTKLITCSTLLFNMSLIYHEGYLKLAKHLNTKMDELYSEDKKDKNDDDIDIDSELHEMDYIFHAQHTLKEKYAFSQEKLQNLRHKIGVLVEKIDGIPTTKQEWTKRFLQEDPRLLTCCRQIINNHGKEQTSLLMVRYETKIGKPVLPSSAVASIKNPDQFVVHDRFDAKHYICPGVVVRNEEKFQERFIFTTLDDLNSVVQSLDYLPVVQFEYRTL